MSRQFIYKRMTANEFRDGLAAITMPPLAFGRIFGFDEKRIRLWISGEQDIPIWVARYDFAMQCAGWNFGQDQGF